MATPALPGNRCRGTFDDGSSKIQFKCLKGYDELGQKVFTCTTWRLFSVKCPKVNFLCNERSTAYVAAVTVCNQRLF